MYGTHFRAALSILVVHLGVSGRFSLNLVVGVLKLPRCIGICSCTSHRSVHRPNTASALLLQNPSRLIGDPLVTRELLGCDMFQLGPAGIWPVMTYEQHARGERYVEE